MTESDKEKLHQKLESKIENMLDKLIEADEDLENNGDQSSLKFSDDISSDGDNKNEEEYPFEKEFFNTQFFQNEENSQTKIPNINTNIQKNQNIQNCQNNLNQNFPSQINLIYNNNNYNQIFSFNYLYPKSKNYQNNNSNTNYFGMVNNNSNNNNINPKNNDTLNTTTASFTSNFDNSYNMISLYSNNNNNSFMNFGYQNCNNSFNNENSNFIFNRTKKYHNSFFAGDRICFNQKLKNYQKNYTNKNGVYTNVELEILLIEANKILNKIEKIDQVFFNKLKGKFEQIIRTHKGSRIFQNYLKNTHIDILHQLFLEIKNKLPELLKDNYANYFCKKFFDCLNQKDRIEYLIIIQNDLKNLAIDVIATYPNHSII